jgi:4-hydroxybenzoate polyprenyltransferase
MLALQASIGAANDLADVGIDRDAKPGKPLPRGLVGLRAARAVAVGGVIVGLALAVPSGSGSVVIALIGVGLGLVYDLRLSRTAWSWLPLALALPLVPIFAWVGARGFVPASLWLLVPLGLAAGFGLAIANGLADFDRDAAAAVRPVAVGLGRATAWRLHALAMAGVVTAAILLAPMPTDPAGAALLVWILALKGGCILLLLGVALAGAAGPSRAGRRERGWELEALGTALVGLAWVSGIGPAG